MNAKGPLDWERFRGDLADAQRSSTDDVELDRVRARLFHAAGRERAKSETTTSQRPTTSRRRRVGWALVFAASLALGLALWVRVRSDRPLSFETGVEGKAGQIGVLLFAQSSATLPVRFSDGSILTMTSASRARITDTNPEGATVLLDEGSIHAAVVHRPASRWRIAAGPFTVLVTGTKFDVAWSASDRTFDLNLHEGFVTVLGPSLPAGVERHMSPGEHLRVSVASTSTEGPTSEVETTAPDVVDNAHAPSPASPFPASSSPASSSPASSRAEKIAAASLRPSWRQLAHAARYTEALAAAEADNFQTLCRRESSADLLLLADTAHFAGSTERADQAFRSVRARFVGAHEAAVAAFSLGRISYDERHNFRAAADWFQTYLREEAGGTLAREASGRLIEAHRAAGNLEAAREAAKTYLATYPAGPHAALARSVGGR
jgi:ferric-dicitrate binding protein FerR (iron transport regulator)